MISASKFYIKYQASKIDTDTDNDNNNNDDKDNDNDGDCSVLGFDKIDFVFNFIKVGGI